MLRRRRNAPSVQPPAPALDLEPRWQALVDEVTASRGRLQSLIAQCRPGPLQDRLGSLARRVEGTVDTATAIATRAQAATRTVASMDAAAVRDQLKDARRRLAEATEREPHRAAALEAEVQILVDQYASLSHLTNAADDAAERLRLLDLRLDAAVARAAQLVLRPDAVDALDDVDRELTSVVEELSALQAGLDAVG